MKNKNLKFLAQLINTNFPIVYNSSSVYKSAILGKFATLELFDLLTSLKQFLKILRFLKAKENSKIIIFTKNEQVEEILTKLIEQIPSAIKIIVKKDIIELKIKPRKTRCLLIFLDYDILNFSSFPKFLEHKQYLFYQINVKLEKDRAGAYKIYNSLEELKKIVFLYSILSSAPKKRKINFKKKKINQ